MDAKNEAEDKSCSRETELSDSYYNDLLWIYSSSPLIDKSIFDFSRNHSFTNIDKTAVLKQNLLQFISTKNLRMLGPYFEGLWEFSLLINDDRELKEKNLQVIDDKKTLGEFDFIYFDKKRDSCVHLEVSVKYFLGVPQLNRSHSSRYSELSSWIGPNKNDRLDKKFYKLRDSQSRLSENLVSQKLLQNRGINEVLTEVCLLGYLFYPFNQTMPPPEFSFENHNRGTWCTYSELLESNLKKSYWKIIEKPFWLSQFDITEKNKMTHEEFIFILKTKLELKNFPILSGQYSFDKKEKVYKFKQLFFIVPDNWNNYAI